MRILRPIGEKIAGGRQKHKEERWIVSSSPMIDVYKIESKNVNRREYMGDTDVDGQMII
jgi:hypothetical protein